MVTVSMVRARAGRPAMRMTDRRRRRRCVAAIELTPAMMIMMMLVGVAVPAKRLMRPLCHAAGQQLKRTTDTTKQKKINKKMGFIYILFIYLLLIMVKVDRLRLACERARAGRGLRRRLS